MVQMCARICSFIVDSSRETVKKKMENEEIAWLWRGETVAVSLRAGYNKGYVQTDLPARADKRLPAGKSIRGKL
jgi:hypothetical protein